MTGNTLPSIGAQTGETEAETEGLQQRRSADTCRIRRSSLPAAQPEPPKSGRIESGRYSIVNGRSRDPK